MNFQCRLYMQSPCLISILFLKKIKAIHPSIIYFCGWCKIRMEEFLFLFFQKDSPLCHYHLINYPSFCIRIDLPYLSYNKFSYIVGFISEFRISFHSSVWLFQHHYHNKCIEQALLLSSWITSCSAIVTLRTYSVTKDETAIPSHQSCYGSLS